MKPWFNLGAFGHGVRAILAVGTVILAILENPAWKVFLAVTVILWFIYQVRFSKKRRRKGRRKRRRR